MPTLRHENTLRASGFRVIAGVDEAGRGPLAGPVCVAAVVLPEKFRHRVLNDSKQLSHAKREQLYDEITQDERIRWHCVSIEVAEIDRVNILQATWQGMRAAVMALNPCPDAVLIDGTPVKQYPVHHVALVDGDSLSFSIAAASIIAKVTRDRIMTQLAQHHPEYGFEAHKGYGTKQHLAALRKHGPCTHHRRSFAPVAQTEFQFDTV
ncbi:MAG: ribonuclease HII [Prosthecobacter sp.]